MSVRELAALVIDTRIHANSILYQIWARRWPRSLVWNLAETGWKTLFRLNYCERKTLFQLRKKAKQAEYGVSRTEQKCGGQMWFSSCVSSQHHNPCYTVHDITKQILCYTMGEIKFKMELVPVRWNWWSEVDTEPWSVEQSPQPPNSKCLMHSAVHPSRSRRRARDLMDLPS